MKKLICLLITSLTCAADPVSFSWRVNPEPDLYGYRLYTGRVFSQPETVTVVPPDAFLPGSFFINATIEVPPGHCVWLTAFRAEQESFPAGALCYNPVLVELVLQNAANLPAWTEAIRWELFRVPDVLFTASMLNVVQTLEMTPERVGVRTNARGDFKIGVDTSAGKKFYRSYVASRPL